MRSRESRTGVGTPAFKASQVPAPLDRGQRRVGHHQSVDSSVPELERHVGVCHCQQRKAHLAAHLSHVRETRGCYPGWAGN